jgi:hypothetical protein
MFCQHCGGQLATDARFCTVCGTPVSTTGAGTVAAPDPARALLNHLPVLSVLWVVYSIFRILMALWAIGFSRYMLPMFGRMMPPQVEVSGVLRFMSAIYWASGVFAVVTGALGLWAAWALWHRDPAGRTIALIIAFISLISIPFGTAIGIYTLVVLLPQSAAQSYARLVPPG